MCIWKLKDEKLCGEYRWNCGLTAGTPGSAPGPLIGNEYGKPLSF